jgi:hypothetical protein
MGLFVWRGEGERFFFVKNDSQLCPTREGLYNICVGRLSHDEYLALALCICASTGFVHQIQSLICVVRKTCGYQILISQ